MLRICRCAEQVRRSFPTDRSCGDGDGDGGDESEVVPGKDSVPQRRQDEGQRQPVPGGSVVTHPEMKRQTRSGAGGSAGAHSPPPQHSRFQPHRRLDVPVVDKRLEAGRRLWKGTTVPFTSSNGGNPGIPLEAGPVRGSVLTSIPRMSRLRMRSQDAFPFSSMPENP